MRTTLAIFTISTFTAINALLKAPSKPVLASVTALASKVKPTTTNAKSAKTPARLPKEPAALLPPSSSSITSANSVNTHTAPTNS